jgi:hypothetical protein
MKWVSGIGVHGSNPQLRMSALGHKRTFSEVFVMSALPPKSGHQLSALRCPLCAKNRHCAPQQDLVLFDHLVGGGEQ